MYYEKLDQIYESSECKDFFPKSTLELLSVLINQSLSKGKLLISPYKLSSLSGLGLKESIQFFMYFTLKDGIFDIVYFFDCSRSVCGHRIFLNNSDLNNPENEIVCEECEKEYLIEDIQAYIKAHFKLKEQFTNTTRMNMVTKSRNDRNSTFEALKGLPNDLKQQSPSYLSEASVPGEGDSGVSANDILASNTTPSGFVINSATDLLLSKIYADLGV